MTPPPNDEPPIKRNARKMWPTPIGCLESAAAAFGTSSTVTCLAGSMSLPAFARFARQTVDQAGLRGSKGDPLFRVTLHTYEELLDLFDGLVGYVFAMLEFHLERVLADDGRVIAALAPQRQVRLRDDSLPEVQSVEGQQQFLHDALVDECDAVSF